MVRIKTKVIVAVFLLLVVVVAGDMLFGPFISSDRGDSPCPEAIVMDTNSSADPVVATVLVENPAYCSEGTVNVTLTEYDQYNNTEQRHTKQVYLKRGQDRWVQFEIDEVTVFENPDGSGFMTGLISEARPA
jgi:FlaG/FlaF family flagellin (archaellin)